MNRSTSTVQSWLQSLRAYVDHYAELSERAKEDAVRGRSADRWLLYLQATRERIFAQIRRFPRTR